MTLCFSRKSQLHIYLTLRAYVCQNMGSGKAETLPASLVLTFLEGVLGSPVPMALLATTLNSYSTQGLSSTAMDDSMSPVTGSGSANKVGNEFVQLRKIEVYRLYKRMSNMRSNVDKPYLVLQLESFYHQLSYNFYLFPLLP